jgi:hypothetical protein
MSAPTGELAGSGWELQGMWGGFVGTPISECLFITAKHVGGQPGDIFELQGRRYVAIETYADSASDLAIWRVCGSFPAFATLYPTLDEVGRPCVLFGRGVSRGEPVVLTNSLGGALKGWRWRAPDNLLRWGQNRISAVQQGGTGVGTLLKAAFDAAGGTNEALWSGGDSGGALFLQRDSMWRLAGIAFGVDGPYNTTNTGPGFTASLFDTGGLYQGGEGKWVLSSDTDTDKPGAMYATRIASRLSWIQSIIAEHGQESPTPILESAPLITGPFAEAAGTVFDPDLGLIRLPAPATQGFFRLRHCRELRILSVSLDHGQLELRYE